MADGGSRPAWTLSRRFTNPIAVDSRRRQHLPASGRSSSPTSVNEQTGTIQIVGEFPHSKICCAGTIARRSYANGSIIGATVPQAAGISSKEPINNVVGPITGRNSGPWQLVES